MYPITRVSPILLAVASISIVMVSTASAQWRITRPGSYKMSSDRNIGKGDGIIITAQNVTLDLNGFTVSANTRGTGRGIVVENARNVKIHGGIITGFNTNVDLVDSQNVSVYGLQISGDGLAPSGGPTEIGIRLINSWGSHIQNNSISSVNLGIFVRGARSTGNRITQNVVVGGSTAANNLLGICYNPEGGTAGPEGPRGDAIYNNHIARFGYAVAVSDQSISNMFTENTLASFIGAFREQQNFVIQGGTNVEIDNTSVIIPSTNLERP